MWQPTTLSLSASTISFISVFSSRPLMVPFIGRNLWFTWLGVCFLKIGQTCALISISGPRLLLVHKPGL